jgi:o-succinylbenzoate synthase
LTSLALELGSGAKESLIHQGVPVSVSRTIEGAPPLSRQETNTGSNELARVLGFRDLVLIIIGTVIGSGIFLVPGAVLRPLANSVPLAMAVWITGGVLSLLGALTYGELSAMKPQAGGLYIYIRDCFGSFLAFLFGWTLFFVISSGSVATLAVAFSNYLAEFVPLSPALAKMVSVLMIAVICAVNVRGTRQSADLQNVTTAIKVAAIVVMGAGLLWLRPHGVAPATHTELTASALASGFGLAMISVLWAYEGWQYATFTAGETLNPQRNFPLGFLAGALALIAVYLFANVGYLAVLGADGVANSNRVAATAVSAVLGPVAAKFVALTILVSIFSAANSIVLTSPRVYYAMAKDGIFFRRLSEVHPRFGTPAFAVIAAAAWAAILAASGTFQQLLTYVVFIGWIFYALAAASVFVYRRRRANAERPYRVPGYPITPLVFILAAVLLAINTIVTQTSFGVTQDRRILLVEVVSDDLCGWGEVTTGETPSYNPETTDTAWYVIADFIAPLLIGKTMATATEFPALVEGIRGHEMAKAGVENALWDLEAQQKGMPLWKLVGGNLGEIACGVSLGIRETPQALVKKVEEELASGYQRIKLKIKPGKDLNFVAAVRKTFPKILLSVDANSAYRMQDAAHLKRLDQFNLLMIEQPLNWDDIYIHSKLQAQLETAICLDECINNSRHALAAIELQACRIINVKLGRVGGHSEAHKVHDLCRQHSIPVWCGGMLESGIGRAHNIAMSTLPGFTLPGDVSASRRYWDEDIIEPPVEVSPRGTISVPKNPGLGFAVRHDLIKRLTTREKQWKASVSMRA